MRATSYDDERPQQQMEVVIEEPRDIPPLVEAAQDVGAEQPVAWLLDHQEDAHISRAFSEPIDPELPDDITQVRRGDGGYSWYHAPADDDSRVSCCYTVGVPMNADTDAVTDLFDAELADLVADVSLNEKMGERTAQQWFNDFMEEKLSRSGYDTVYRKLDDGNTDLYADPDRQQKLVGTSVRNTRDVVVLRGCWYESIPDIDDILAADLHEDVAVQEFYDAIAPADGLYETIQKDMDPEREPADAVYTGEQYGRAAVYMDAVRETDAAKWPCVLYGHPETP